MSLDESVTIIAQSMKPFVKRVTNTVTDLDHEIDFIATRKVREIPSRLEMGPLGIGVALVHLLFTPLR